MGMSIEELVAENDKLKRQLAYESTALTMMQADYENRLKADMVAMLEDLDLQIDEFDSGCGWDGYIKKLDVHKLIQQKINELKAESEE